MEKLYHTYPEMLDVDIKIERMSGTGIMIDPQPFYPGGGGQPADSGYILADGEKWIVQGVTKKSSLEVIDLDRPLPAILVGKIARALVDEVRRNVFSRLHTALHIINGVIYNKFQASVTGVQMHGDGTARIDFNLPDTPNSMIRELEPEINTIIDRDIPVLRHLVPLQKALETPGMVRTENRNLPADDNGMVRVIEIEGIDSQGCGGTHVTSTRQCGNLKFLKVLNKGRGNRRLKIALVPKSSPNE